MLTKDSTGWTTGSAFVFFNNKTSQGKNLCATISVMPTALYNDKTP